MSNNASRDDNFVTTLIGVDLDGVTPSKVWVDNSTHRLLVSAVITSGTAVASTIADGADVAEGATTDAAVTAGSTGTVSGKLRQISADLSTIKANQTNNTQTLAANQSVNQAQVAGATTSVNNGVAGTGVQRVTLASDSTGQVTLAAGANSIGTVDTELPAAAALADDTATPTAPAVGSFNMIRDRTDGNFDMQSAITATLNSSAPDSGIATAGLAAQFDDASSQAITEDRWGNLRISANRNLYSTIRDAAGNERGLNVDANGEVGIGAIRTSVTPGTAAANLGKAEDAAHTTGDTGVMMLGVRNNSASALAGTDADYIPLTTGTNGELWVGLATKLDSQDSITIAGGLMPAATALNTYAVRITTNTTTTPTSSTAYISSIIITTEVAGTTSTVTVRDKQGTPQVLVNGLTTTAASLTPTVLNFQTPVKMTSGIDIITAGAVAGTVDIWVNYFA